MIFDSHAHYDSEQFDIDRDELLGSVLLIFFFCHIRSPYSVMRFFSVASESPVR